MDFNQHQKDHARILSLLGKKAALSDEQLEHCRCAMAASSMEAERHIRALILLLEEGVELAILDHHTILLPNSTISRYVARCRLQLRGANGMLDIRARARSIAWPELRNALSPSRDEATAGST